MGREPYKSPKMLALELSDKRDILSTEIDAIVSQLTAPGAPGLTGNLLDEEGFPRADVDIAGVRAQRHRLATLRTDYKELSRAMEAALQAALPPAQEADDSAAGASAAPVVEAPAAVHFADQPAAPPANAEGTNGADPALSGSASDRARTPFAVIDSVSPGSPADTATLRPGDRVAAFGAISLRALHSTAAAMQALPATVRSHTNRRLDLIVHRGEPQAFECLTLPIVPAVWAGTGLLGCHVLPLRAEEDARYRPDVATAVARR